MGGSTDLIQTILDTPGLDAWPVKPDDSLACDADRVNDVPQSAAPQIGELRPARAGSPRGWQQSRETTLSGLGADNSRTTKPRTNTSDPAPCPRQESNLDLPLRRRSSYPLDYEGSRVRLAVRMGSGGASLARHKLSNPCQLGNVSG